MFFMDLAAFELMNEFSEFCFQVVPAVCKSPTLHPLFGRQVNCSKEQFVIICCWSSGGLGSARWTLSDQCSETLAA
jgi:hypothetical protein